MAKKDKIDETPIEFYIPGPGKRSKVPIPINQPNWIYQRSSNLNPNISEWFIIGTVLVIAIALGILLIKESMYKSPLWIAVITFGIFAISKARSAIIRTIKYSQEADEENNVSPRKLKKKFPKHRKDYK